MVQTNKFELLDQNQRQNGGSTPFVKAPRLSASTGLVQQRTEQYLQRIAGVKDSNRQRSNTSAATSPGEGTESEEEKLKKDANRSEKGGVFYLMNEGLLHFFRVFHYFCFFFQEWGKMMNLCKGKRWLRIFH